MRIFTGPRIVPLDEGPEPEAFAVDGEWVAATGTRADLRDRYPSAEWVDLDGALVVPGFNDAHCHPSQAALARVRVDLSAAADRDAVRDALRVRAATTRRGSGWSGSR
ncbi:hypothetical protein BJF90_05755 [Pseudonocardia sp. CNS-004]|nr:hypothetical protein BJF90_05755 [Pseudonocardia sp. CNS-004]